MGGAWIAFWWIFVINLWETSAITSKHNRRSKVQDDAVRNFRHIESPLTYTNTDWEIGLKEATNQALLRERYHAPDLRRRLLDAPLIGKQNDATPFGDVAIVARGQLYVTADGEFAFVQDRYQNDCEGCHAARRCTRSRCHEKTFDSHRDERILALWTVKRLRHRDYVNGYRYETEYTISLTDADQPIDYAIPGHVFVIKHDIDSALNARSPPTTIYNRRIPHRNFRPEVLIGVGPDGRKHFLHSYPAFYTSFPVHPTRQSTDDPREIELYRALIEALASKTSTTQQVEDGPHRFSLINYGEDSFSSQTTKFTTPTTDRIRFPVTVVKPTVLQMVATESTRQGGVGEVTQPITTVHYFTAADTSDEVEAMKQLTSTQRTTKEDGLDFLFPIAESTTTSLHRPSAVGKDADVNVFPEQSPTPTRQSKVYHATFSAGKTTKTSLATSETPQTTIHTTPPTSKLTTPTTTTMKNVPSGPKLIPPTIPPEKITSSMIKLATPMKTTVPPTNTTTSRVTTKTTPTSKLTTPKIRKIPRPRIKPFTLKLTTPRTSTIKNIPYRPKLIPPTLPAEATSSTVKLTTPTETTLQTTPPISQQTPHAIKITPITLKLTTPTTTTSYPASELTTPKAVTDPITPTTTKDTPTTIPVTSTYKTPPTAPILTMLLETTPKLTSGRSFTSKITSKSTDQLEKTRTTPLLFTTLMSEAQTTPEPVSNTVIITTSGLRTPQSTTIETATMETDNTSHPVRLIPTRPTKITVKPQSEPGYQLQAPSNDTQTTTAFSDTVATSEKIRESTTKIETDINTSSTLMPTTEEYASSPAVKLIEEVTTQEEEIYATEKHTTTEDAYLSTTTTPTVTMDDFLLGNGVLMGKAGYKKPMRVDFSEDDIFGNVESNEKPTIASTTKITESKFAGDLFGNKRSPKAYDTGGKIIFSDFYEASTASVLQIGGDAASVAKLEPLTSQSFSTSISFEVNKRNEFKDNNITSDRVGDNDDGKLSTETSTKSETEARETKKAFDDAALQLVNHARSINYLNGAGNSTKRVKYKRRRNYLSKSRKPKRKQ